MIGLSVESWALKNKRRDQTLSHATRRVFRTDTDSGKVIWITAWAILTHLLVPHIYNCPEEDP